MLPEHLAHHNLSDEDLLSLLPGDQEAVLDIDVAALSVWAPSRSVWGLLPEPIRDRLSERFANPLADVDALCVGVRGFWDKEPEWTVLLRARPKGLPWKPKLSGPTRTVAYHGMPVAENDREAVAHLTDRTSVWGSRLQTRQTIDIFRGVLHGARKQTDLMAALKLAPAAKQGRPPVLWALVMNKEWQTQVHDQTALRFLEQAQKVAVAVAVGDGIDVGVIAAYPTRSDAAQAAQHVKEQLAGWSSRALTQWLGLQPFLARAVVVAVPENHKRKTPELHLAYRLAGEEFSELLRKIEELGKVLPLQKQR